MGRHARRATDRKHGNAPAVRDLVATQATKQLLSKSLMALQQDGTLSSDVEVTERGLKRHLQEACEYHATQDTPYGMVVQTMELGAPGLDAW